MRIREERKEDRSKIIKVREGGFHQTPTTKKISEFNKFSFEGVEYLNKNFKRLSKQRIHTVVSGIIHWSE